MRKILWLVLGAVVSACTSGGDAADESVGTRTEALVSPGANALLGALPAASGFFDASQNQRVWMADVDGDGRNDLVGLGNAGQVVVVRALAPAGGAARFAPAATWLASSRFAAWTSSDYWTRVWVADVNADHKADVVGMAADGVVWVAPSTGEGFTSEYASGNTGLPWSSGCYSRATQERTWLTDVTGDGRPDVVCLSNLGLTDVAVGTASGFTPWTEPLESDPPPDRPALDPATFLTDCPISSPALCTNADKARKEPAHPAPPSRFGFITANGWMPTSYRQRVWVEDVTGDRLADMVGLADDGSLWVEQNLGGRFGNIVRWPVSGARAVGGGRNLPFAAGYGWFAPASAPRVWLTDVTGDGLTDFLGISADGEVIVARNVGGTSFDVTTALPAGTFRTADGWFAGQSTPFVNVADVTGDGRADIVGLLGATGQVVVAEATASGTFTLAAAADAALPASTNLYDTGRPRLWLGDVTGDGVSDIVAVLPGGGGYGDGDLRWVQPSATSGVAGARRPPLAPAAPRCALPTEANQQADSTNDAICEGAWQYTTDAAPCTASTPDGNACTTYGKSWECGDRGTCQDRSHGLTSTTSLELHDWVWYLPGSGNPELTRYSSCQDWARWRLNDHTTAQDRADGAFVVGVESDYNPTVIPPAWAKLCYAYIYGIPNGNPRYKVFQSKACAYSYRTCTATLEHSCRSPLHAAAPGTCGSAGGTFFTDARRWGETLGQLRARVPGVKNAVCMTGSAGDANARAATLLGRLEHLGDHGLGAQPSARLRELLVRRLELLLETQGETLNETNLGKITRLYETDGQVQSGCGGTLTPPQTEPAACAPTLAAANGKLIECSRLAFEEDPVTHAPGVPAATRARFLEDCLNLGATLAALPDTAACKKPAYAAEWQAQSNRLVSSILHGKVATAVDSGTGMLALAPGVLKDRLRYIALWYRGRTDLVYRSQSLADRAGLWRETADVARWFWAGVEAADHLTPSMPSTVAGYSQAALEFDRNVLEAIYAADAPLRSAPALYLTADALSSFATLLGDFGLFHDLGCRFKDCGPGTGRTDVGQLSLLLAAVADPATLATRTGDTSVTLASSARWLEAFQKLSQHHDVLRAAVLDATLASAYDDDLVGAPVDAAATPKPIVPLALLVRAAGLRAASYAQTGFFTPGVDRQLEMGVQHDRVGLLGGELDHVRDDLAADVLAYKGARDSYVTRMLQMLQVLDEVASSKSEATRILDQDDQLNLDLEGLRARQRAEDEEAGRMGAAYQDAIARPNAGGEQLATLVGASQLPFPIAAQKARFRDSAGQTLDELVVLNDDGSALAHAADPGDLVTFQIDGQWQPTCTIGEPGLRLLPDKDSTAVTVPADARTGPEGYMITWDGSSFKASNTSSSASTSIYADGSVSASMCAGLKAGSKIDFIGFYEAYISLEACVRASAGLHVSSDHGSSEQDGNDVRGSAAYQRGVRLPKTPFPDQPAGALLLVQRLREASGGQPAGAVVDVRVLAPQSQVPISAKVNLYFVVNDAACGSSSGALGVTLRHLVPNAASYVKLGPAMEAAMATLHAQGAGYIAQGRLLVEDRAVLRGVAYDALRAACPTCTLETYPAAVSGFFENRVSREVARIEREVEINRILRERQGLALQLAALADRSKRLEGIRGLTELLPEWALDDMNTNHLRIDIGRALELVNGRIYPVLQIRYAGLLAQIRTQLRPRLDALTGADWAATEDRRGQLALDVVTAFRDAFKLGVDGAKNTEVRDIAVSFWNPAYALPDDAGDDDGPGGAADTLPPIDETHVYRVDEARARTVWSLIASASATARATVPFRVDLEDLLHKPSVVNTLACSQGLPVIKGMALYMMTQNRDGAAAYNQNLHQLPAIVNPELTFPNAHGAERYRLKIAADPTQANANDWAVSTVRLLMGKFGDTMTVFPPLVNTSPEQYKGFEGLSPFTTFYLDVNGENLAVMRQARELVLVFRVEIQTVTPEMDWIPSCSSYAPVDPAPDVPPGGGSGGGGGGPIVSPPPPPRPDDAFPAPVPRPGTGGGETPPILPPRPGLGSEA
jgi:hypothetical protein